MNTLQFAGQVALVTGASRGIGAAIALELAKQGLKVVGTATTPEGASKVNTALAGHADCPGRILDVTDGAAVEALVDAVTKELG
ncbi:MAG: SDR family NAD(P)-dependent oxidoreductase, partial [Sulfuritalea sp.]|nr:SDR family NAD(P)-dependent oxidoreductase [Sulfuritalea sp.]